MKQQITEETMQAIKAVVAHFLADEHDHYKEQEGLEGATNDSHIYHSLETLNQFIKNY